MFEDRIDKRLRKAFGRAGLKSLEVNRTELPSYRFVDLYRAVQGVLDEQASVTEIVSQHEQPLHLILRGVGARWQQGTVNRSPSMPWFSGPGEETYFPTDTFWLCWANGLSSRPVGLIRLSYVEYSDRAYLEVASRDPEWLAGAMSRVLEGSNTSSIYRGAIVEVGYEAAVKDECGDVESPERLQLRFREIRPIPDADFVVDEAVFRVLRRNVIDLHRRRQTLKAHGVPIRRGVMLYGPPGTGKTFACRYLCRKLEGVTRILVTGSALFHMKAIVQLARALQPSLLILEDVDLVFMAREVSPWSSAIGDLLDLMDGLRPREDIGFLLTTNAIDRMEAAIKDRPGRISQLIHLGPPHPELRHRYLARYLEPYQPLEIYLAELVKTSDGTTQAFLKEWVHRAVQVATERLSGAEDALDLKPSDFQEAMDEMKEFAKGSSGQIVGFHR